MSNIFPMFSSSLNSAKLLNLARISHVIWNNILSAIISKLNYMCSFQFPIMVKSHTKAQ